ncbi:MAG TPA: hypothetical protein VJM31_10425 [Vicinamibacterales bacterium]|nr:hypothetical protein [Vicinamibacterales bacterium]
MLKLLAGFDAHRADLLLEFILAVAAQEDEWRDREMGPIHLVKYVYLGDLAYAPRNEGQSYTGSRWQFYHFGPWEMRVYERIEPALGAIDARRKSLTSARYQDDIVRFSLNPNHEVDRLREQIESQLPVEITRAVRRVVHEFGSDTTALLRYVYLTAPMLNARPGDFLTLPLTHPTRERQPDASPQEPKATVAERKRRKQLVETTRAEIQRRLLITATKRTPPSPAPRYDEVFFEGSARLDAMDGERLSLLEGEVDFDDSVWSSSQRRDQEPS